MVRPRVLDRGYRVGPKLPFRLIRLVTGHAVLPIGTRVLACSPATRSDLRRREGSAYGT
jgi:hypothetical protein